MKLRSLCALALFCMSLSASGATLRFSTFVGGTSPDTATAVATDLQGNTIVVGDTYSTNFLGLTRSQSAFPDGFVVKLDANGAVVFKMLIRGGLGEAMKGVATDPSGNIYITGHTQSADFALKNAFRDAPTSFGDAFVIKMTSAGEMIYSTYFGGNGTDLGVAIEADTDGNAYVIGLTNSSNLPLVNEAQKYPGGQAVVTFLFKIASDGSTLRYSTYVGGNSTDYPFGVGVDEQGNAYVVGGTTSSNFPTTSNAFQRNLKGTTDGFLTKFTPNGAIAYSTFMGGNSEDALYAIDVRNGGVYVAGVTGSNNFPTRNPLMTGTSGGAAVAAKLTADGEIIYSTYLSSGVVPLHPPGIGVNDRGEAAVLFVVASNKLPTKDGVQPSNGGEEDGYVVQLNAEGSERLFATYFGGGSEDAPLALDVDAAGRITFAGLTNSTNLPLANAVQSSLRGSGSDAFVARIQINDAKRRAARH